MSLPVIPNHLNLRGRIAQLGKNSFRISQYADLRPAVLTNDDGSSNEVLVKILRQRLTQEFVDNVVTAVERSNSLADYNVSPVHGLIFVGCLLAIVIPHYRNGNVVDYLRRVGGSSGVNVLLLIEELFSVIARTHARGIVHGNIHAAKLMVDEAGHLVLADIGIDAARNNGAFQPTTSTYRWKAPEHLLQTGTGAAVGPTMAGDIYALGLTVEELHTLRRPFSHVRDVYSFYVSLKRGNLIATAVEVPAEIQVLIKDCCVEDPIVRPTAEILMERLAGLQARSEEIHSAIE